MTPTQYLRAVALRTPGAVAVINAETARILRIVEARK